MLGLFRERERRQGRFDTLGLGTEPLLGRDPPQSLANVMHAAWIGFAANGSCGWPKYDSVRRRTMRFDTVPKSRLARSFLDCSALLALHATYYEVPRGCATAIEVALGVAT